jgi:ABC-type oligopeptide transport system substrate-binding subunit
MRQIYKLVDRVVVTDTKTITFYLNNDRTRESVMILAMMPVLSKSYWSSVDFNKTTFKIPVTNGPYKISSVDEGRQIILNRDLNYWANDLPIIKGLYNFDRLQFDYFRDDGVAFESFLSGDLDIRTEIDPTKWMSAYKGKNFESGTIQKYEIPHGRTERMWGFIFNTRKAPFDSIKLREALSLAIDKPWINKNLFHGLYRETTSFFANSELEHKQSKQNIIFNLRQNLRKADELLKESGFVIKDGIRINAQTNKPLTFEILIGSPDDEKVALAYKRTLEKLGIKVTLRSLDSTSFRDRLIRYDYDMVLYFWQNSLSPGTEQALNFGCNAAREDGRFNYSGICTPEIDRLTALLPDVKTREELVKTTRALDKELQENFIAIPLFHAGIDRIAASSNIGFLSKNSLYGVVFESLWSKTADTKN